MDSVDIIKIPHIYKIYRRLKGMCFDVGDQLRLNEFLFVFPVGSHILLLMTWCFVLSR